MPLGRQLYIFPLTNSSNIKFFFVFIGITSAVENLPVLFCGTLFIDSSFDIYLVYFISIHYFELLHFVSIRSDLSILYRNICLVFR